MRYLSLGGFALLCLALPVLGGCSQIGLGKAVNETQSIGGIELLLQSPEHRVVVFKTPDDVEKICAAPQPDAVSTNSEGFTVNVQGEGLGGEQGTGAGILGGRDGAVLITRDLLYRTCEISLNYKLGKDEALALYRETLVAIQKISLGQSGGSRAIGVQPALVPLVPNNQDTSDDEDTDNTDDDEDVVTAPETEQTDNVD